MWMSLGVGGNATANALHYSTGGTAFGADYRLNPALLVGAFAGYAGTRLAGMSDVRSLSGMVDVFDDTIEPFFRLASIFL